MAITTFMPSTNIARKAAEVTGAKTLAEADCGVVQVVTTSATLTLPSTTDGHTYIIVNGGKKNDVTVTVSPASVDKIMGNGFTSADDKDAINTLGNYGDMIVLHGDGANGWVVNEVRGTWTRQA